MAASHAWAAMTHLTVDNPYTLETACEVPLASLAEVDAVLDRAQAALPELAAVGLERRKAVALSAIAAMEKSAERICQDITRCMGKPLAQAQGELKTMAARGRVMVELAERGLATIRVDGDDGIRRAIQKRPLGVVLDLPAWNYPLLTAVNVVVPAFLAGNAVIVKHSPRSPLCGPAFADAFAAAGAEPNWVQALDCDHDTTERAVADPRVDHVVFTGSVFGGERISQAAAGRFLQLGYELGGNDPAYVAEDADLTRAVEGLVDGAIYNAGQSCCAVERVYVHARHYDAFVAAAERQVRAYVMGDPMHRSTTLGPIAQPHHVGHLAALVADAEDEGATLLCGGRVAEAVGRGRFFAPTLLSDVPPSARVMQEEQFGPIVAVQRVQSDEEALALMSQTSYGLTASVWTSDMGRAERLAEQLKFGTIFMNRCDFVDPLLPWSGVGQSGRGHSLSVLGFDQLTRPRSLHLRP